MGRHRPHLSAKKHPADDSSTAARSASSPAEELGAGTRPASSPAEELGETARPATSPAEHTDSAIGRRRVHPTSAILLATLPGMKCRPWQRTLGELLFWLGEQFNNPPPNVRHVFICLLDQPLPSKLIVDQADFVEPTWAGYSHADYSPGVAAEDRGIPGVTSAPGALIPDQTLGANTSGGDVFVHGWAMAWQLSLAPDLWYAGGANFPGPFIIPNTKAAKFADLWIGINGPSYFGTLSTV